MLLGIGLLVRHTYIFLNLPVHIKGPLLIGGKPGIRNKRHFGHFSNGDGGERKIYLYPAQQQIAPAALKRVALQAVGKVSGIKIRTLHIYPGAEIHDAALGGYVLSGNQIGQHFHFLLVINQQLPGEESCHNSGAKGGGKYFSKY